VRVESAKTSISSLAGAQETKRFGLEVKGSKDTSQAVAPRP
jgi:hypothetical protein